jgi:N-acetylglucosaminyldiphosphoundecaprenol N-acetyl-beta-D-mannosaminyltransferase
VLDRGKRSIAGVNIDVVDYEAVVQSVIAAAQKREALTVTALAVHGVMTGNLDAEQRYRLNRMDFATPDGQGVRWALRILHGERLPSRVSGPELMHHVCREASMKGLPIHLFGSRAEVLKSLERSLKEAFPHIEIAGATCSRFRRLELAENEALVRSIRESGARIVFVGLGCPRQEVWAFENSEALGMPVLAVGAAFDFHSGRVPRAPRWMQEAGLEWFFRLSREPRRLWRRYLLLNSVFCWKVACQAMGRGVVADSDGKPPTEQLRFG